jgi:putative SOS response-associated peptidase YedK
MCGRYAATLPPQMMVELFNLLNTLDFPPRYNIKPTEPIVAIWEQHGRRTAQLVRWGFVPSWVRDPRDYSLMINARAESMLEKPAFRDAVRHSRCIIPASGYYEWLRTGEGAKQPYYITTVDGQPMAFAGLYSQWAGPNGEEVDTAAIVTVEPNREVSEIYERMPAILTGDAIDLWLNTRDVDSAEAARLCRSMPDGTMKYHPVGRKVGSNDADGPDLIRPLTPAEAAGEQAPRPRRRAGGDQLDLF